MAFLDEIPGIDAVVLFIQGGEEGGNALADVLSGKENFSGKLTDTIPLRYEDIPFDNEFSYLNGNLENEYYCEGVYVGYRYFDSFGKAVRYPFGFGLSYTSFQMSDPTVKLDGTTVSLTVKVSNTGAVPGKEVAQVYASAPAGKQAKEYQRLVAFAKTETLAPGAAQEVELRFDLADCASYAETEAQWRLDAGRYLVRVGNSSQNTEIAAVVDLSEAVVVRQCRNCYQLTDELPAFAPDKARQDDVPATVPVLKAAPSAFVTETVDYAEPQFIETAQEKAILITFDRKIKKDAFYIYKAYLSTEPFVHLCGRRYAQRTEDTTEIKVYSNQQNVTLYVDGKEMEAKTGDKVFRFSVPITGEHEIKAVSGELSDTMTICKVDTPNKDYVKEGGDVVNWFDQEDEVVKEGYFSIKDSVGSIKANPEAAAVYSELTAPLQAKAAEAYGDVAKNVQLPPEVLAMMDRMSVEATLKQMGKLVTPEFVHKLNFALNQVKK